MPASQNGWVANDESKVASQLIPGTAVKVKVRKDAPGLLLLEFASAFDREVEDIDNADGCLDDWGYAERPIRGSAETSNHASGTAIDLNALKHVLGKKGTFTGLQVATIRRLIDITGGVLFWGGDYDNPARGGGPKGSRVDEMHVEIAEGKTLIECQNALDKMRAYNASCSDTLTPEYIKKVQAFFNRYYSNANLKIDGIYGPLTAAQVSRYQKNSNLPVTGKLDIVTRTKMGVK